MAKELSPWIANLVKDHDANHGPDLSVSYDGLWAVQIEEVSLLLSIHKA